MKPVAIIVGSDGQDGQLLKKNLSLSTIRLLE